VNTDHVDRLVAGLARVDDESLRGAVWSDEARALFDRITSTPGQRPNQRPRVFAAAVVAAVLLGAPALALNGRLAKLFDSAEPAPAPVAASFYDLERGAPTDWSISGSARLVLERPTPEGPVRIWAARRPTGFCYAVGTAGHAGFASTCVEGSEAVDVWPFTVTKPAAARTGGPFVLVGYSADHDARSIEIRFDDGERVRVPLTWISDPIDAGFFALPTAETHWLDGKERFEATALDGSGDALASSSVEVGAPTG
jgi:hypothetical protein